MLILNQNVVLMSTKTWKIESSRSARMWEKQCNNIDKLAKKVKNSDCREFHRAISQKIEKCGSAKFSTLNINH